MPLEVQNFLEFILRIPITIRKFNIIIKLIFIHIRKCSIVLVTLCVNVIALFPDKKKVFYKYPKKTNFNFSSESLYFEKLNRTNEY